VRLSRSALSLILLNHVVEVRFRRRRTKTGFNTQRRMLCTNDRVLLQSNLGRNVLNFLTPTSNLKYDPRSKNLVITWDIFYQNWRMVNCDDVDVVSVIKTSPDSSNFWKYFQEKIQPMSKTTKASFMNN
jgi:hypothetical protein